MSVSRTQMNLSGGVRVEEVEGGDDAGVTSPVLETSRHVGVALQPAHPHSPGPAVGDAGVQVEAELSHVASLEVQQDVLAGVVPAQCRHCGVARPRLNCREKRRLFSVTDLMMLKWSVVHLPPRLGEELSVGPSRSNSAKSSLRVQMSGPAVTE